MGITCADRAACLDVPHGICDQNACSGVWGNGECSSCDDGYFGPLCDQQVLCDPAYGVCAVDTCAGPLGNGLCSSCLDPQSFGPLCLCADNASGALGPANVCNERCPASNFCPLLCEDAFNAKTYPLLIPEGGEADVSLRLTVKLLAAIIFAELVPDSAEFHSIQAQGLLQRPRGPLLQTLLIAAETTEVTLLLPSETASGTYRVCFTDASDSRYWTLSPSIVVGDALPISSEGSAGIQTAPALVLFAAILTVFGLFASAGSKSLPLHSSSSRPRRPPAESSGE
jgi:hypothetical protein